MTTSSAEQDLLLRRVKRERDARLAAESILESKSLELYEANMELRKTADDLQEQMLKYQTIFEYAAQGIVTLDRDWKIKSFNPTAEKIFLVSGDEAIDRDFRSLFRSLSLSANPSIETVLPAFGAGEAGPHAMVGLRGDGTEFAVELTTSLVKQRDDCLVVALIRDLTDQQQLESQLRHAQKMESVGHLAAGIAHEINTPIQFVGDNIRFLSSSFEAIGKLLSLVDDFDEVIGDKHAWQQLRSKQQELENSIDLPFLRDEIPEAIEQSVAGIDRVATIVQAMKEFSHPGDAQAVSVDINSSILSTITVSRNEWKYVAEIQSNLDEDLPLISGYAGDLHQAFLNIIVNAAHAIESNQDRRDKSGKICVATRRNDESVEISFTDNGCGIAEENLRKVFNPFFTTKKVGKGTGQGLAVVHSVIVEKHNGEISVESSAGQGTTITIRLPIASSSSSTSDEATENAI